MKHFENIVIGKPLCDWWNQEVDNYNKERYKWK